MLQWLSEISWVAVGQIIMIDLLLGGDNAVVIALACRNLPPAQRTKGIILGTAGAIVLRVILVLFAVALLKIPFLKLIGGLLLIWIGIKLLMPEDEGEDGVASPDHLWGAVRTVIVADLVMSVDNVIAIAGAAEQAAGHHQTGLVIFGLLVSIPIIVFGSQIVLKLMDRFPVVILLGAGLLGWIAGSLILGDPAVQQWTGPLPASAAYVAGGVGAAFVMLLGRWLAARKSRAQLGA
jgi:YjbE family integral membrane protein